MQSTERRDAFKTHVILSLSSIDSWHCRAIGKFPSEKVNDVRFESYNYYYTNPIGETLSSISRNVNKKKKPNQGRKRNRNKLPTKWNYWRRWRRAGNTTYTMHVRVQCTLYTNSRQYIVQMCTCLLFGSKGMETEIKWGAPKPGGKKKKKYTRTKCDTKRVTSFELSKLQ